MADIVHLHIIETDAARFQKLSRAVSGSCCATVVQSYADAVKKSGGLDAILVPLMSAMEWGSVPPVPSIRQTQVVAIPPSERKKGKPRFAIPGIAVEQGHPLPALETAELILRESWRAIQEFNSLGPDEVLQVGASSISLGFDRLDADQAAHLIALIIDPREQVPVRKFA